MERVEPDWAGRACIVAASGPSLTEEVARKCVLQRLLYRWRIIAVQDAYKRLPFADAMYACDDRWWDLHKDCDGFIGEKWSTHEADGNNKLQIAEKYGVRLVAGAHEDGFSRDPSRINYGWNSGFQAINLAILKGCKRIVLVGFDMRRVNGAAHFFGEHPPKLRAGREADGYSRFIPQFERAAKKMAKDIKIVNATPDSALTCFPMMSLDDACREPIPGFDVSVYRNGPESDAAAG